MDPWIPYTIIAASFIFTAIGFTKKFGERYAWINRKIIHFSLVPAILMFYRGLIPGEVFSISAFIFGLFQLWPHLSRREFSWYQIKHNYGEVFFAFSASAIPLILPRNYATALLLAMAVSDGVTGLIRHYYFTKNGFNVKLKKHWTGSLGFLATASIIGGFVLGFHLVGSMLWAAFLMLAEYQPYLDDNLAVPLVGSVLFLLY